MAKSSLPSVDVVETGTEAPKTPEVFTIDQQATEQVEGYISRNMIDITKRADTKITRAQALLLMSKMRSLQDSGTTLADGSAIRTKSDAIRWMIEQPLFGTVR